MSRPFLKSWGLFVGEDGFLHKTPERMEIERSGKSWWDVYPNGKAPPVPKTLKGKIARRIKKVLYRVWNFFRYRVWGGYQCGGLAGLYHWLRCHLWDRYHIINISGMDGYKWGWLDRDHVLLLASFKILKDFVEKEDPTVGLRGPEDYGSNPDDCMHQSVLDQVDREREVRALYDWWCNERPKARLALWEGHYSYEKEEALDKKDEEMLIRLAKIRQSLWT